MQHNYYGTKPCMTEFSYAQGLHGACCRVKKVQYFQTNTTHLETCTKKYMNLNSVTEQNDAYSGCLEADTDGDTISSSRKLLAVCGNPLNLVEQVTE